MTTPGAGGRGPSPGGRLGLPLDVSLHWRVEWSGGR